MFLATRAHRDELRILAHRGQITREQEQQGLSECEADSSRLAAIQRSLAFADQFDWPRELDVMTTSAEQKSQPAIEAGRSADLNLAQIAAEIAALAGRLEQRAAQLPAHTGR